MISSPGSPTAAKVKRIASEPPQVMMTLSGVEGDAVAAEIAGDGLPQLQKSLGRAVAQDQVVVAPDGVEDGLGRRDVGVADVEVIDFDALGHGRVGVGLELPDRRSLDGLAAPGDIHG